MKNEEDRVRCIDCNWSFKPPDASQKRCNICRDEHEGTIKFLEGGYFERVCKTCRFSFMPWKHFQSYCGGCQRNYREERQREAQERYQKVAPKSTTEKKAETKELPATRREILQLMLFPDDDVRRNPCD